MFYNKSIQEHYNYHDSPLIYLFLFLNNNFYINWFLLYFKFVYFSYNIFLIIHILMKTLKYYISLLKNTITKINNSKSSRY